MGVNLKDLMIRKEISISDLSNRSLVVDGNNVLYQFLATIRQPDGTPLMDSHGNVTSHLNGLFHRTTRLMQSGIKLAFVFDGKAPDLKSAEQARRAGLKKAAAELYEAARKEGDVDSMKKYGMRTSRLTKDMVEEAKQLLRALGIPVIQAPSEGEAQAALLVKNGDVYAEISQDYDCLLFGVPRMVQNLTISARKKVKDKLSYETVRPAMIELEPNLKHLGISQDQLISLGMLVGTDYNVGGIKGIGPKKAISMVMRHGQDRDSLFSEADWDSHFDYVWESVFSLFKEMPVTDDYSLDWRAPDADLVKACLCEKHDFSVLRVEDTLERLNKVQDSFAQKGLGDFM